MRWGALLGASSSWPAPRPARRPRPPPPPPRAAAARSGGGVVAAAARFPLALLLVERANRDRHLIHVLGVGSPAPDRAALRGVLGHCVGPPGRVLQRGGDLQERGAHEVDAAGGHGGLDQAVGQPSALGRHKLRKLLEGLGRLGRVAGVLSLGVQGRQGLLERLPALARQLQQLLRNVGLVEGLERLQASPSDRSTPGRRSRCELSRVRCFFMVAGQRNKSSGRWAPSPSPPPAPHGHLSGQSRKPLL